MGRDQPSESSSSELSDENDLDIEVQKSTATMRGKIAEDRAKNKRGKSWENMLKESDSRQRRNYSRSRSRGRRDYGERRNRDRRPPRAPPSRRSPRRSEREPPKRNYVPQSQQHQMRRREYENRSNPTGGYRATGARGYQNYRRRSEQELEQRRKQRNNAAPTRTVWARTPERSASPKEVKEAFEDVREKEKLNPIRAMRKVDSDSDSDSSDSEEERRKKKKKKKKKKRKKKKSKKRKKKVDSSDSDSDEEPVRKKKKAKKKKKKKKKRNRDSSSDSDSDSEPPMKRQKTEQATVEEFEWVEKTSTAVVPQTQEVEESDDDDMIGPKPAMDTRTELRVQEYGDGLMPGEGKAMATYVALGQRIPRRGEVGLTSGEITNYEDLGYVMSGSRYIFQIFIPLS